jgi:hypothetical protein
MIRPWASDINVAFDVSGSTAIRGLISDPFHVLDQNLLAAAIVELRCPAVSVAGDSLRHFQRSSVLQKVRDPCRPKRMGRKCIRQSGVFEPAFEHSGCIDSGRRAVPEFSRLT